jgi:hypothetical protein
LPRMVIRALLDNGWQTITRAQWRKLKPGTMTSIERDTPYGRSTLYDCYRPPRGRDESPVAYYRRTGVVDDNFTRRWHGWYYCNPAHCKHRWRSKRERDKHMGCAYAILG